MSLMSMKKIAIEMRRDRVFELAQAGWSPRRIAVELGVTHKTILRDLEKRQDAEARKGSEAAELQLGLQVARIKALTEALWRQVMAGDETVQTTMKIVQLMEQEAELLGLDAPKQRRHSEPDEAPKKMRERPDFSALTDEELDLFLALMDKIKFKDVRES